MFFLIEKIFYYDIILNLKKANFTIAIISKEEFNSFGSNIYFDSNNQPTKGTLQVFVEYLYSFADYSNANIDNFMNNFANLNPFYEYTLMKRSIPQPRRRIGLAFDRLQSPGCAPGTDDNDVTYLFVGIVGYITESTDTPITPLPNP